MKGMEDVVSEKLLQFMQTYNYVAPPDWQGCREVEI